jgi:hypothetical protein
MSWIQTYSGERFDLANPTPEMVNIEDIAHSLAYQCRYTGHCAGFYSVAQHSVHLSYHIPDENLALQALMHDAHEAYAGDMAAPTKLVVPDYALFEARMQRVVQRRFNLPPLDDMVKLYDRRLCYTEMLALFDDELDWRFEVEPLDIPIVPWPCGVAEVRFMSRFEELTNERAIQK